MSFRWLTDRTEARQLWTKLTANDDFPRHPYAHPDYAWLPHTGEAHQPGIAYWQTDRLIVWHPLCLQPLPESTGLTGWDAVSPYGVGGPLCLGDSHALSAYWQAWQGFCRDHNVLVEFIRFHPLLANHQVWQPYYQCQTNRSTVWVDMIQPLGEQLAAGKRRDIRRAQRFGTDIRSDWTHWHAFVATYQAGMQRKQADSFYRFSPLYFESLRTYAEAHNGCLLSALGSDGLYLGGAMFLAEGLMACYHLAAVTPEGRQRDVASLLLWTYLQLAVEQGRHQVFLGGGMQAGDNLEQFKGRFSPHRAPYTIGWHIHNPEIYTKLKPPIQNSRVMFYRV